jgi:beta-lactam-binding protein with PASTA domain
MLILYFVCYLFVVLIVICLLYFFVFNVIVFGLDSVSISSVQNYKEASAVRIAEDASAVQNTVEAPSSKTVLTNKMLNFPVVILRMIRMTHLVVFVVYLLCC